MTFYPLFKISAPCESCHLDVNGKRIAVKVNWDKQVVRIGILEDERLDGMAFGKPIPDEPMVIEYTCAECIKERQR